MRPKMEDSEGSREDNKSKNNTAAFPYRRLLAWGGIIGYVCIIYMTLPYAPAIQKYLVQKWGEPAEELGAMITIILGLAAFIYFFKKRKRARFKILISGCIIAVLYILGFHYLVIYPPEQFHFAEYGLLSWFLFYMFRKGRNPYKTALLVLVFGLAAGATDEIIQHFLPERHFEWRDMLINMAASLLGLLSAVLIAGAPEPASPSGNRGLSGKAWPMSKKPHVLLLLASILILAPACFLFEETGEEPEEPLNVLLLTVDALRPANMSCYGYTRPTTPNLDRFAREGTLFTTAVSSCAWTNPSLLSILTSRLPSFHGVTLRGDHIRNGIATLPLVLKHHGYQVPSVCYLNAIPNFFSVGFDPVPPELNRPAFGEALKSWLRRRAEEPFFLWSHYRNIHLPYNPPSPYDRMFRAQSVCPETDLIRRIRSDAIIPADTVGPVSPAERECVVDLYDGEVRLMDDYFGEVMHILEQTGMSDRTLVIVTADHGEELFEHGMVGHASTSRRGTLYEEEIRIPLILRLPGKIPAGKKLTQLVRNIDIMPTVLDILEIPMPAGLQGRSLLPLLRGEKMPEAPAICETVLGGYLATPEEASNHMKCIRTGRWKFTMLFGRGEPEFSLFDLLEDPDEKASVYGAPGTPGEDLKKELLAYMASIPPPPRRFTSAGGRPTGTKQMPRISILAPQDGTVLHFENAHGTVALSWTGDENLSYMIEYDVGENAYHLEGAFEVKGNRMLFGPYSLPFWKSLAPWNPFRFRVRYAGSETGSSPWITFTIEE